MYLVTSSQTITAVLADVATPAPTYLTAYSSGPNRRASNGTLSNTAATIVPAPVSEFFSVELMSIHNADNASATLTINFVDGASTRKLWVGTLAAGETLQYVAGQGFHCIDSAGRIKYSESIALTLADSEDLSLGTTTGSKIGTGTDQKLGFWDATPVVQPAGAAQAAVTPSTDLTGSDTVDAAAVLAAVQAVETLANGLRTALVSAGIIKGAA